MAVPPAAMMARLNADLSNVVPETVKTERTFLNLSPENPDQLVLLLSSRRGRTLAVFLSQALPPPRVSDCENRRDHLHSRRFGEDLASHPDPAES